MSERFSVAAGDFLPDGPDTVKRRLGQMKRKLDKGVRWACEFFPSDALQVMMFVHHLPEHYQRRVIVTRHTNGYGEEYLRFRVFSFEMDAFQAAATILGRTANHNIRNAILLHPTNQEETNHDHVQ